MIASQCTIYPIQLTNVYAVGKVLHELDIVDIQVLTQYTCIYIYTGVLCGSCKEGLSVTALYSHCVTCHNAVGVVFAILGKGACMCQLHGHLVLQCEILLYSVVIFQVVVCLLITLSNFRMRSWMFSILFYLRVSEYIFNFVIYLT